MPSTTNFGWTTPADTDLVKDGAAAIRTLGNGVDASFVDLKGGTTGQILSKNSNTDLDFTWIANDQGDITAVTAGTGLTGGGTAGAVTLTNDMATTITASGDIVVGTGSGTYDNLPIGTTGQVLTADTTVSPYKVKWAAAASPSYTWTTFTPSWVNLTQGNGTVSYARYLNIGNIVFWKMRFIFGSTTSVSSAIGFAIPYGTVANQTAFQNGNSNYLDSSSGNQFFGAGHVTDAGNIYMKVPISNIAGNYINSGYNADNSGVPFTWATNDELRINGWYEIS